VHQFEESGDFDASHSLKKLFPGGPPRVDAAIFNDRADTILLVYDSTVCGIISGDPSTNYFRIVLHILKVYKFFFNETNQEFKLGAEYPKKLEAFNFRPSGGMMWIDGRQLLFSVSRRIYLNWPIKTDGNINCWLLKVIVFKEADDFAIYDEYWNQAVESGKLTAENDESGASFQLKGFPRGVKGGFQQEEDGSIAVLFTDTKVFLYDAQKKTVVGMPKILAGFLSCLPK
jgi:hypothetical protein